MNFSPELPTARGVTTRDIKIRYPWGSAVAGVMQSAIIVPEGTKVIAVDCCLGGYIWAVESVSLVTELTGDSHMANTRYIYIDQSDVLAS